MIDTPNMGDIHALRKACDDLRDQVATLWERLRDRDKDVEELAQAMAELRSEAATEIQLLSNRIEKLEGEVRRHDHTAGLGQYR